MTEFIGARISLVSKSDIRYVGTLHEINSETSTVALENVTMLGTEGRRPDNEVAALDSIYEYILFRGTDVKDLRIEEAPIEKKNKAPQIPNDPAILGSGSRPTPKIRSPYQQQISSTQIHGQHIISPTHSTSVSQQTEPLYIQQPQNPQFYPQQADWCRNVSQAPVGYNAVPYTGPPAWNHGPQNNFPTKSQFSPYGYSTESSNMIAQQPGTSSNKSIAIGVASNKRDTAPTRKPKKTSGSKGLLKAAEMPAAPVQKIATPPVTAKLSTIDAKSDVPLPVSIQKPSHTPNSLKSVPIGPKTVNRVQPALPLRNIPVNNEPLQSSSGNMNFQRPIEPSVNLREATQAASAAVSAAMAKLPLTSVHGNPDDNKGHKNPIKNYRKSSKSNASACAERTSRGNHKANGPRNEPHGATPKVEVPPEDFDFQSANAKFNKEDLIKEAISAAPITKSGPGKSPVENETPATYNKATSFFDNISSEVKDREEAGNTRPGGRKWRGEEQKKNLETFGEESIDNNHRGGYRGRGRGRGGYRGRGYSRNIHSSRGRADHQNRGNAQAVS
ncbi:putative g2 m phase checkpoint control protein [Erysiphe necator]|uniref:Putative g2 m phase checkpoint control protein n=1 Tax=Uncinula necator TaxID=52586 RepID=A0A0B1PAQ3_UNCNE|nr:putative g2 m phase checkpoint control protein [Erysiphe necator]